MWGGPDISGTVRPRSFGLGLHSTALADLLPVLLTKDPQRRWPEQVVLILGPTNGLRVELLGGDKRR